MDNFFKKLELKKKMSLSRQEGCEFLEETCIYGDRTLLLPVASRSVTLSYEEQLMLLCAFIIHYIMKSLYPCPKSAFSPTILYVVTKLSHF